MDSMDTAKTTIDTRRTLIFLAFTFGIAWLTGLVIYLTGGLVNSPAISANFTLALVLMATTYMWAPALAHILTRWITREGMQDLWLRPNFRRGWPYWVAAWFLPAMLTLAGAAVFFLLFPSYFDSSLPLIQQSIQSTPELANVPIVVFVIIQLVQGVLLSPVINALFTFGEEFGWRAYLLPKLLPLGWRKAMLLMGLIWGVWHWPVIFMGYEYGFDYPGFPWLGPLLFIWITFCFGVFLSWVTLRSGSVWPAVIGHAAINGIASVAVLALTGTPNMLLGPLPVGIIGSVGYGVTAVLLFFAFKLPPQGKGESSLVVE
jgi:membrane protease YdiL (CAAX protease family)